MIFVNRQMIFKCGMRSAECGTQFKCGVRNAERGTTSLHFVTLTRNEFIMQNAE